MGFLFTIFATAILAPQVVLAVNFVVGSAIMIVDGLVENHNDRIEEEERKRRLSSKCNTG